MKTVFFVYLFVLLEYSIMLSSVEAESKIVTINATILYTPLIAGTTDEITAERSTAHKTKR